MPDSQTPPDLVPAPPDPDELSDPTLTPLPTHPGIKYVAMALAAIWSMLVLRKNASSKPEIFAGESIVRRKLLD